MPKLYVSTRALLLQKIDLKRLGNRTLIYTATQMTAAYPLGSLPKTRKRVYLCLQHVRSLLWEGHCLLKAVCHVLDDVGGIAFEQLFADQLRPRAPKAHLQPRYWQQVRRVFDVLPASGMPLMCLWPVLQRRGAWHVSKKLPVFTRSQAGGCRSCRLCCQRSLLPAPG